MKQLVLEIIFRLLYLTPIGYILSLYSLEIGKKTPGVYIALSDNVPTTAFIKQDPLFIERIEWGLSGVFLLVQAFIILWRHLGWKFGAAYAWIALVFGIISFVSAFFPSFPWNKRSKIFKISILEMLIIFCLIVAVIR